MRTRILPRAEWGRFPDLDKALLLARPDDVAAVVVEDGDRIVARMMVLRLTHLEGVWIDPEYRNAGVTSALLRASLEAAKDWSSQALIAGAADERMVNILARMGAAHLPLQFYVLPNKEASCRGQ